MEEREKKTEFMIPTNVVARWELFGGIGWKELIIIAICAFIGLMCAQLVGLQKVPYQEKELVAFIENKEDLTEEDIERGYVMITKKRSSVSSGVKFMCAIIPGAIAFFLLQKSATNENLWTLIKNYYNFSMQQRTLKTYSIDYGRKVGAK